MAQSACLPNDDQVEKYLSLASDIIKRIDMMAIGWRFNQIQDNRLHAVNFFGNVFDLCQDILFHRQTSSGMIDRNRAING